MVVGFKTGERANRAGGAVPAVTPAEWRERLRAERQLTLTLKVIPKASKNEVADVQPDGALKVKVTAAPERGKANAAVCDLLAKFFDVPKRNVEILRGETSHSKQVRVTAS
jgi:uncharacterized protein (TIGR00251 family)